MEQGDCEWSPAQRGEGSWFAHRAGCSRLLPGERESCAGGLSDGRGFLPPRGSIKIEVKRSESLPFLTSEVIMRSLVLRI